MSLTGLRMTDARSMAFLRREGRSLGGPFWLFAQRGPSPDQRRNTMVTR